MIIPRHEQRTIYETAVALMPDHKELLWEDWMLQADRLLEDGELIGIVQKTLEKRRPKSVKLGRDTSRGSFAIDDFEASTRLEFSRIGS